jgi:pimeloyl-ACP methyl ester carboxylesterase
MENYPRQPERIFSAERVSPAEQQYQEAYKRSLENWPEPFQESWVESRFGRTHLIEKGSKEAKPLILLPGMSASATLWYPNADELSRTRRLLALDVPGDAGLSEAGKAPQDRREYVQWLTDVMDHLSLDKADVAGISYGGWLALNFATLAPNRINKLIMLGPAGWIKLNKSFRAKMLAAWYSRSELAFNLFINSMSVKKEAVNDPVMKQMRDNFRHLRRRPDALPEILSDDELRHIQTPTLFLVGDEEVIYNPNDAIERAGLIPGSSAKIVPEAGHILTYDRPKEVDEQVLAFLEQ